MYDIIPDIHGQYEKLTFALAQLGYADRNGAWRHSDPGRTVVFLGDFIDRGPCNAKVLDLVRRMIEAGSAQAVMGNHELNAILYHTDHPEKDNGIRERSAKNAAQHRSFLNEFPLESSEARQAIDWMKTLPLYLEMGGFRVVHACWDARHIAHLGQVTRGGVLSDDQVLQLADEQSALFEAVETTTKGPETGLPEGYGFHDKEGVWREYIRVRWWAQAAETWGDLAASVPDPSQLPDGRPTAGALERVYPREAPPVFCGHYWMTGAPVMQAPNVLCLDYSAGMQGPLTTYTFDGSGPLDLARVTQHDAA